MINMKKVSGTNNKHAIKYVMAIKEYVIAEMKYIYPSDIFCPSDRIDLDISP